MKKPLLALVAALSAQATFAHDPADRGRFLVSYDVGALVSLGGARNLVDDAMLMGLTASYDLTPNVAVVGSASQTRADADGLFQAERSVYQYDLGVQGQLLHDAGGGVILAPFVAAGLGGRSRDFRDRDGRRETDLVGYVAIGGRLEVLSATLGVTARDYLSRAGRTAAAAAGSSTRNDLALFASVSFRL